MNSVTPHLSEVGHADKEEEGGKEGAERNPRRLRLHTGSLARARGSVRPTVPKADPRGKCFL